jgi:uncharacterized protein YjeT (DUF2065 family)
MEQNIRAFAAISFVVIGLSHLLQPYVWVEFFTWVREKGRAGMFVEGFLSLLFGALVVAFHNVWSGLPVVLTLVGWGQVLKSLMRFVAPQLSLRVYRRVTPERAWEFRVAGIFALALGFLCGYLAIALPA